MTGQPQDRRRRAGRRPVPARTPRGVLRRVRDSLPALLVVPPVFEPTGQDSSPFGLLVSVFAALGAGLIVLLRLRFPRAAVAAAVTAVVAAMALGGPFLPFVVAVIIGLYSLARHTDRRTGVVAAAASILAVGTSVAVFIRGDRGPVEIVLQVVGFFGFAAALGEAGRTRQAFVDAVAERARRAEETKETEARHRVTEERLKIARDLHDVLAHQIAVISMHANVAATAIRTRPEDAERSLATVKEASRTVLAELGSLLQLLREADPAPTGAAHLVPVPGLSEVDQLIEGFGRSGLRVELRTVGVPAEVPAATDIVAYQVIQEGLTNAHKHGTDSSALLQIEYQPHDLEVSVVNTLAKVGSDRSASGADPSGPGHTGHGLLGARERVAALDGVFSAGPGPGPVYRLVAKLPLSSSAVDVPVDAVGPR